MEKRFSIAETLRYSFYMVVDHFGFFLKVVMTYLSVLFAGSALILAFFSLPLFTKAVRVAKVLDTTGLGRNEYAVQIIQYLTSEIGIFFFVAIFLIFLLVRYLGLGFLKICFELHDTNKSKLETLFSGGSLLFKSAVAETLFYFLCSFGSLFFVIPGIYFAIRYCFINQCIIDKNVGPLEAFRLSAKLTQGIKWELFALWFLIVIFYSFSFSLFGLSFFVLWPLSSLAFVHVYRKFAQKQY